MFFFHKHKFGKVEKDGFQYCEGCGKAIHPAPPECQHVWKPIHRIDISGPFSIKGHKYTSICKKCGEMNSYTVNF